MQLFVFILVVFVVVVVVFGSFIFNDATNLVATLPGIRPAYCGASKGQFETLKLLVSHGADLWIRNSKGDMAIHEAAGSGRKDLLLWILRQRSSAANMANNDGRCPLHVAAINNNIQMCKVINPTSQ